MTPAPFSIPARSIDDARPIKVIVIGAGISGVLASILLPQRIKNLDLTIYDKNPDLGGTWYENRYPGCACGEYLSLCLGLAARRDCYPVLTLYADKRGDRYPSAFVPALLRVKSCLVDILCFFQGNLGILERCG